MSIHCHCDHAGVGASRLLLEKPRPILPEPLHACGGVAALVFLPPLLCGLHVASSSLTDEWDFLSSKGAKEVKCSPHAGQSAAFSYMDVQGSGPSASARLLAGLLSAFSHLGLEEVVFGCFVMTFRDSFTLGIMDLEFFFSFCNFKQWLGSWKDLKWSFPHWLQGFFLIGFY